MNTLTIDQLIPKTPTLTSCVACGSDMEIHLWHGEDLQSVRADRGGLSVAEEIAAAGERTGTAS